MMAKKKKNPPLHKATARRSKKSLVWLYVVAGVLIFLIIAGIFLFLPNKEPVTLYIFPENVKQGDTVFIKVNNTKSIVTGKFGDESLDFFNKNNSSEWVALLGVDITYKPGDYEIVVVASGSRLTKTITVSLGDFAAGQAVLAPNIPEKGYTSAQSLNNIINNDGPVLKKILSNFTKEPYFNDFFAYPLSSMQRSGYAFGKFISYGKVKLQHLGIDLRAYKDTEIHSINNGKVVGAVSLPNYGKTVIIDHGLNIFSLYLHLDEFKVGQGDMVQKGQVIGLSGDTGYSTAPHLHFSIRVGASRVDPVVFIETARQLKDDSFLASVSKAMWNIFKK